MEKQSQNSGILETLQQNNKTQILIFPKQGNVGKKALNKLKKWKTVPEQWNFGKTFECC